MVVIILYLVKVVGVTGNVHQGRVGSDPVGPQTKNGNLYVP